MADSKISALSDGTTPASGDLFVIARSGANYNLTWDELIAAMPGAEIGRDQITSGVNVTATVEANANVIITCAAHTFDGNPVIVEFNAFSVVTSSAAFGGVTISLWEGTSAGSGTEISQLAFVSNASANQLAIPVFRHYRFTPSAGSHTYSIRAHASSTTGTPSIAAGNGSGANGSPTWVRFLRA